MCKNELFIAFYRFSLVFSSTIKSRYNRSFWAFCSNWEEISCWTMKAKPLQVAISHRHHLLLYRLSKRIGSFLLFCLFWAVLWSFFVMLFAFRRMAKNRIFFFLLNFSCHDKDLFLSIFLFSYLFCWSVYLSLPFAPSQIRNSFYDIWRFFGLDYKATTCKHFLDNQILY